MYIVYILLCADHTLYTGITNNLEKRLANHNEGKGAKYMRGKAPFKLVYSEEAPNRSTALKREIEIKKMPREDKLNLIANSKI